MPDTMKFKLVPIRGNSKPLELSSQRVTIGRNPDNALPLLDELASRYHCVVEPEGENWTVRDLGSRNGTLVNELRIEQAVLRVGDVIRVGSHEWLFDGDAQAIAMAPERPAPYASNVASVDAALADDDELSLVARAGVATPRIENSAVAWMFELAGVMDSLPPKGSAPEEVSVIDANNNPSAALAGTSDGPNAVRLLLQLASKCRCTDVHMEPKLESFHVRMRVDGDMVPIIDLPRRVGELTYGLIKTACNMHVVGRDAVQEGHFSSIFPDRRVEYRVSFTPSVHGQKLVLRVLDIRGVPQNLVELGMPPFMIERLRRVCDQDSGLLLVAGPTGSGKSTTLFNCLRIIDRTSRNVVTIEDPVEYKLEGATQIPIDDTKGNTFGMLLRSVLRQDPDVILVGEIRDEETARTAMQAAMTGHVVFSTVHAKDTISTVFRLLDLKVEPYLVASSLDLVLAQRLVRVLCDNCKRAVKVTPAQATRLGRFLLGKTELFVPTGCARCLRTGYRGRRALFELLDFNDDLRDMVLHNPTITGMRKIIDQGMFVTLGQFGWKIAAEGSTSLDEVDRVAATAR